jgi:exonuclease VII small subunit
VTELNAAIEELERSAERLRTGDVDREEAAALVERCAELAATVGAELERRARSVRSDEPPPGQEQLL